MVCFNGACVLVRKPDTEFQKARQPEVNQLYAYVAIELGTFFFPLTIDLVIRKFWKQNAPRHHRFDARKKNDLEHILSITGYFFLEKGAQMVGGVSKNAQNRTQKCTNSTKDVRPGVAKYTKEVQKNHPSTMCGM